MVYCSIINLSFHSRENSKIPYLSHKIFSINPLLKFLRFYLKSKEFSILLSQLTHNWLKMGISKLTLLKLLILLITLVRFKVVAINKNHQAINVTQFILISSFTIRLYQLDIPMKLKVKKHPKEC